MLFRRSARLRCAVRRHLSFLLPCIANPISPRFTVSARLFLAFGGLGFRLAGWRRGENGMRRCLAPSTCRRLYRPRPLLLPAVTRIANRALACHSRPPGTAGDSSARRRSIQARPLMRDATGARTPWNGHCGRRRMWVGPRTAMGGEWYEQGERGGANVVVASVADRCVDHNDSLLERRRRHWARRVGSPSVRGGGAG